MKNPLPRLLEWARYSRIAALRAEVLRLGTLTESQARQLIEERAQIASERAMLAAHVEDLRATINYMAYGQTRRVMFGPQPEPVVQAASGPQVRHMSLRQATQVLKQDFLADADARFSQAAEEKVS